jgi:hypothetical protein
MAKVVIGIFDDYAAAGNAIDGVKEAGFAGEDISIVGRDMDDMRSVTSHVVESHGMDKTVGGMIVGGAVGGLLVGLATAIIPGVGGFLVAGPIMAAISGAAAGTYVGFLAGVLAHFDVPQYQAKVYETHLTAGKVLVAVHTDDPAKRLSAEQIMDRFGAIEVDTKAA